MAVIDASVYIALIHAHEPDHARSWTWFERAVGSGEPIRAPVILLVEVAAAVSRGVGDRPLARQVVRQLARFRTVELVPVGLPLAERAASIAVDHQIRGCDAVYVALAEQLGDCLVTLDEQQLEGGAAAAATRRPGE
jgi:predicted nucleic acid-binding protein